MISAREAAYRSLVRCYKENKFSNLEIDSAIKKYGIEGAERALYTVLVYGSIERLLTLDHYISKCSDKPVAKLDIEVLCILRMTAYQIIFLDRIPNHAAVNEAVELAKKYASKGSKGYVNAVLRRLILTYNDIVIPDLSVKYSIPKWIVDLWSSQYGKEKTVEILEGMNTPPTMTLRVNTLVNTREELLQKLKDAGIKACITESASNGIHILEGISFEKIESICQNGAFVQDEASQLCVEAVGALPEELIIDTCACPGGKSFGMALSMNNKGHIISLDLHKSKLSLVENGAKRLGIDIIDAREHNSKNYIEEFYYKADRVLCDVPCSGLGVMAKKPETRYKDKESVERLPEIQYEILSASANYLKQGGTLIYSTCTLNKHENDYIINKFLDNHADFKLNKMTTYFPKAGKSDGFFVCSMIKNREI
ncbi:MAG: 16S rRNA (cytosine(967)-C(5))-methyltransferase RsmB [Clostridia bacterium]|nr:16S rRNA (cytosine(967)-C(5))-methyltransferase RsmB [Clostridia bacterium]